MIAGLQMRLYIALHLQPFFYSLVSSNLWFYGYVSTTKYLHFGIAKNTKL